MESVDDDELLGRVRRGEVTLLDLRPTEAHRGGHIPGARSIPRVDLKKRFAELPRRQEGVAHCRGPYCVMATDAVELLRKNRYRAHRTELGVVDWHARGRRVEKGA